MAEDARRILLVLVFLAVAAILAGGFYFFGAQPETAAAPPTASQSGGAASQADLPGVSDQTVDAAPTRKPIAATPGQTAPTANPDSRRVNLRLLDAITRQPVAGAEVHYTDPEYSWLVFDPLESERMSDLRERDIESFLQRTGHRTESDASGYCMIPAERSHVEVVARKGNLFGTTEIDYDQGTERVILMHDDTTLEVTVVDYLGRAASGIEVVAYPQVDTPQQERTRLGRTDDQGTFSVLHVNSLAADLESGRVFLAVRPTGGESTRTAVDPLALPTEGIQFQLPPTGSWTFRIRDTDGLALPTEQLGYQRLRLSVPGQERPAWYQALGADSTCRFEHVLLDAKFNLLVLTNYREADLAGPTRSEPDRVTQIRLPSHALILHARAVDEAGQILADDRMQNIVKQQGEVPAFLSLRTGNDGRLTWVVLDHDPEKELSIELRLWRDNDLDVELKHELRLPKELAQGRHDVGDLRFEAGRLLARGRVELVGGGAPKPLNLFLRAEVDGEPAMVVGATTWPEPGVFEIRGIAPVDQLHLQVGDTRYLGSGGVDFTVGATDLYLRVAERGEITARFVVDQETPWHMFRYFLEPRFEPTRRQTREAFRLERAGDRVITNWRALEPGTYDLYVRAPGHAEPIVQIAGLQVTGGELEDSRLDGIALDVQMEVVRVAVVDRNGEPIAEEGAGLIVTSPSDSTTPGFLPASAGIVEVLVLGEIEARAIAPGFLPTVFRVSGGDLRIAMDPAPELSITVQLPAALPDRTTARLNISPSENNPLHGAIAIGYRNDPRLAVGGFTMRAARVQSPGRLSVDLDSTGKVVLSLEQPGDYVMTLELVSGRRVVELDLEALSTLHWDGARTEAVSLQVAPATFSDALREIGR